MNFLPIRTTEQPVRSTRVKKKVSELNIEIIITEGKVLAHFLWTFDEEIDPEGYTLDFDIVFAGRSKVVRNSVSRVHRNKYTGHGIPLRISTFEFRFNILRVANLNIRERAADTRNVVANNLFGRGCSFDKNVCEHTRLIAKKRKKTKNK